MSQLFILIYESTRWWNVCWYKVAWLKIVEYSWAQFTLSKVMVRECRWWMKFHKMSCLVETLMMSGWWNISCHWWNVSSSWLSPLMKKFTERKKICKNWKCNEYLLMGGGGTVINVLLKCQRYMTFTWPHQQIFTEF